MISPFVVKLIRGWSTSLFTLGILDVLIATSISSRLVGLGPTLIASLKLELRPRSASDNGSQWGELGILLAGYGQHEERLT